MKSFSVIVTVLNAEQFIGMCLEALQNQDYPKDKYEVIVVDDGSTDRTGKIIKKFPFRIITLKKNVGQLYARRLAAERAQFKYLAFINATCIAPRGWLKSIEKAGYLPLLGYYLNSPDHSPVDRFFYLMRNVVYARKRFDEPVYFTHKDRFKFTPGGTGNLAIQKELFLKHYSVESSPNVLSDDKRLFEGILGEKNILYTPHVHITSLERREVIKIWKRWIRRGYTFAEFYIVHRKNKLVIFLMSGAFSVTLLIAVLALVLLLISLKAFIVFITILYLTFLAVCLFLGRSLRDTLLVHRFLPIILIPFFWGNLKRLIRIADIRS